MANVGDGSIFPLLWNRCSPSIKHLELSCWRDSRDNIQPIPHHRPPPIALQSLRIRSPLQWISHWLMHDLCPLDVSHLKVLSTIHGYEEVLRRPNFAPARQTIEALDFVAETSRNVVDLSSLSSLSLIRVSSRTTGGWLVAIDSFSTIVARNRIQKIIIHSSFLNKSCCELLDFKLASLPMQPLPALELEMAGIFGGLRVDNLAECFPRMVSKNLLREIKGDEYWFENFYGM
ncbi:hypothetical protein DFH09DRAFT_1194755 [Mycena vulgaris]|nr:hypothetical protein DFH09DRAFT_1194755 [Mycena vulgaris]